MKDEARTIGKRWDHSANGYNDIIQREFAEAGEAWTQLLTEYAPATGKRALDVGCGPGFLAMILAMEGFDVTGITYHGRGLVEHCLCLAIALRRGAHGNQQYAYDYK